MQKNLSLSNRVMLGGDTAFYVDSLILFKATSHHYKTVKVFRQNSAWAWYELDTKTTRLRSLASALCNLSE
jgi:hypothetical protein